MVQILHQWNSNNHRAVLADILSSVKCCTAVKTGIPGMALIPGIAVATPLGPLPYPWSVIILVREIVLSVIRN
jgi:hypothetical protein